MSGYTMHDNATAYIVNSSMAALGKVFRFTDSSLLYLQT